MCVKYMCLCEYYYYVYYLTLAAHKRRLKYRTMRYQNLYDTYFTFHIPPFQRDPNKASQPTDRPVVSFMVSPASTLYHTALLTSSRVAWQHESTFSIFNESAHSIHSELSMNCALSLLFQWVTQLKLIEQKSKHSTARHSPAGWITTTNDNVNKELAANLRV